MYILCIKGKEDEGAYAISNDKSDRILLMFEEEEDAIRYAGLLEAQDFAPLVPRKVDKNDMKKMCERSGYDFLISTSEELIIPPSHDDL